nr:hypothetical protein [Tanacetum cinerariifolium]
MSTPAYVDSETITQADRAQSFRVPVPLPDDRYVVVRQAQLVDTDTELELEKAHSEAEDSQPLGFRLPLMGEEFEAFELSGTRTISSYSSASLNYTTPLSPDHLVTQASLTLTPTRALFHHRTAHMTVRGQPTMFPVIQPEDELGDEDTEEDKEDESSKTDDKGERSEDEGPGLEGREEVAVPEGQQQGVPTANTAREDHDLRMQIAEERLERLELADRIARMKRRHESREEVATSKAIGDGTTKDDGEIDIDRDVRELYTRSGAVRDEIFLQRENHELRMHLTKERNERLELANCVARIEKSRRMYRG